MKNIATFFVITASLISGCALMRPTDPYAQLSLSTPVTGHSKPTSPDQLKDQVQDSSVNLTLDECISLSLKNNPDLKAVYNELDGAQARYRDARSALSPTVRIEGGYEHYSDDQRILAPHALGETGVFSDHLLRSDAVVTVPLFNGGRTMNGVYAASHAQKAQEHLTYQQRDELIFTVSRLFYTIQGLEKRVLSVYQSIEAMESHRQRVIAMVDAKKAAQVDLLRTDVRLANLKYQLSILRNQHATYRNHLATTMIADIGTRSLAAGAPIDTTGIFNFDIIYQKALLTRSDYLAACEVLESQGRRIDIARGAFLPLLALKGGYGIRTNISGEYEPGGSVGLLVSIPLFEGGHNAAKLDEQLAILTAQQNRLHALRLRIMVQIETVLMDIKAARERIETARTGIDAAKEGLRIENMKYEQGKGTISDVLDAQAELLEAETNHDEAYSAFLIAYAQFQLVSGGHSK
jgi:outer membrane protein TolC